jgi:Phytochelatin synthase
LRGPFGASAPEDIAMDPITVAAAARLRLHARRLAFSLLALLVATAIAHADGPKVDARPKLGPNATPIQQSYQYLRTHDAPDYWRLSPYYVPQMSNSACSLATIATVINALRGLPALADQELVSQASLLAAVAIPDWDRKTAEHGEGVTWEELKTYLALSLKAFGLEADIETFRPADASEASLARLRQVLADNERSDVDIALVYYNQGVVTGDYDGPHVSPLGAYDTQGRRVLIMDVDRQWYGPYWTSDQTLLDAMVRPVPPKYGILAGETGGVVRVTIRRGRLN